MNSATELQTRRKTRRHVPHHEAAKTKPRRRFRRQTVGAFILFHLLLPLAAIPWLFSWTGLASVLIGNYVFGSLGICLCYHRALTHGSVKLPKWLEHTFAVFGICSLQDSPAHWVALHRVHHKHSDEDGDPHSPQESFFWGHVGWLLPKPSRHRTHMMRTYTPDLMRDPFYRRLEEGNLWIWVFAAHAVLFFLGGFLAGWASTGQMMGGLQFGLSMFVWGVVARVVYTWHVTWSVNSIAHIWGYRNYETKDNSRNNPLVALVTWGEGWHNNHHADQRSAAHGHKWWEFDVTYLSIRVLQMLGLAKDIVQPRAHATAE